MFPPGKFNPAPIDPGPNPLDSHLEELKKALVSAKNILILIRDNPKLDHAAAGLGLSAALKAAGKSVTLACSSPMRVEFNRLVGIDQVGTRIGNRNLVISFPYVKDSIEKVSYNVDEANFNLSIQPKPGFPALDSSKVNYSYTGAEAQLVFTMGASKLEDLGAFYVAERQLFEQATVVNIDSSPVNTKFAAINLVWADWTSTSEIVTALASKLGLSFDADTATNLLAGLYDATQNFQRFNLKSAAFEAAANLMKAGGRRPIVSPSFAPPRPMGGFPGSPNPFPPQAQNVGSGLDPFDIGPAPTFNEPPIIPVVPQSAPASSPVSPAPRSEAQTNPASDQDSSDDWLRPKIFTGSTKITS